MSWESLRVGIDTEGEGGIGESEEEEEGIEIAREREEGNRSVTAEGSVKQ